MEKKLDLILSELKTVKEEIRSVRSELKEDINSVRSVQPLENPASGKIYLNEFNRIHESIKFVNRRVADIELEVYEVKCQLKRIQKD